MSRQKRSKLLVEGKDDLHAIAELMGARVPWGNRPAEWPVHIKDYDGIENLLSGIPLQLKSSESEILGIVVDANHEFDARWARIRDRCSSAFPEIPEALPDDGLVLSNAEGRRLGVWIMPDNRSRGMLETFLAQLVPDPGNPSWRYAQYVVGEAKKKGASFEARHRDKAMIHTWLAWQDPPGRPFGTALTCKVLDPTSSGASRFVEWFKRLYRL